MRKLIRTGLTAAVVTGTALSLVATPASAATWTVQNGGAKTFQKASTNLIAEDIETGAVVTCNVVNGGATLDNGVSDNNPLATVDSIAFHHTDNGANGPCNGPGGLLVEIQPGNLPWGLTAVSQTGGVTTGFLSGVKAHIVGSDGCEADITGPGGAAGTVDGNYDNADGTLNLLSGTSNNLEVTADNGLCDPLLINIGDHIRLDGEVVVNGSPKPIITMS
ncbi:hypothetical protein [Actinomadura sp. 9N215]|uniref:hypothetical protein n=1 Tax=Actinomadura sp. 9N215 TaxID=3375150 RepID=UPI0037AD2600